MVVAFAPAPDVAPSEVYVLQRDVVDWDEHRYVTPLDEMRAEAALGPSSLAVMRTRSTWPGTPGRRAEICVRIAVADEDAVRRTRDLVVDAYRRLGATADEVPRAEAIARARGAVGAAWRDVDLAALTVSEEEHRRSEVAWVIGLSSVDGTRYRVEVGAVGGDPTTAHAVRTSVAEVADSIGT